MWGLHPKLVMAALQPVGKVWAGRDQDVVVGVSRGSPTLQWRGSKGWNVLQVGLADKITPNNDSVCIDGRNLSSKFMQPTRVQAGVMDPKNGLIRDRLGEGPTRGPKLPRRLGFL